jgi:MFS family permease
MAPEDDEGAGAGSLGAAPEGAPGLITRPFVVATAANFFDFLALSAFFLLPRHMKELGAGERLVGLVMGATGLVNVVATPIVGAMVDRVGRRPLVFFGSFLMAVTSAAFTLPTEVGWAFVVLRMGQGLAFSAFFVAGTTLVADTAPPAKTAQALGLFGVLALATNAIAPALGEAIVNRVGFDPLFLGAAGAAVVGMVLSLGLPRLPAHPPSSSSPMMALLRRRDLLTPVLLSGVVASGFGAAITFASSFAVVRGLTAVSPFFIAYVAASIAVRVVAGDLPDRIGHRRATIPACLVLAAGLVVLAGAGDAVALSLAGVLFGLGHGVSYPALSALVVSRVEAADRGKAMGLYSGAFATGITLSAFAYGAVAEAFGYAGMYRVAAAVVVAGTVAFAFADRPAKVLG